MRPPHKQTAAERARAAKDEAAEKAKVAPKKSWKDHFKFITPVMAFIGCALGLYDNFRTKYIQNHDATQKLQSQIRDEKKLELRAYQLGRQMQEVELAYLQYPRKTYHSDIAPPDLLEQNKDEARQSAAKLGLVDITSYLNLYSNLSLKDNKRTQSQHLAATIYWHNFIHNSLLSGNNPHIAEAFDVGCFVGETEIDNYVKVQTNLKPAIAAEKPSAKHKNGFVHYYLGMESALNAIQLNFWLNDLGLTYRLAYSPANNERILPDGTTKYSYQTWTTDHRISFSTDPGRIVFVPDGLEPSESTIVGKDSANKFVFELNEHIEKELQSLAKDPDPSKDNSP